MRLLRLVRGIVGTALAFAVPWAVIGSALSAAIDTLWPGAGSQGPLPEFYLWVAQSGPVVFGTLGGVAGALYASLLATTGRTLSFDRLTTPRVIALGAAGGFAVGGALFGAAGAYFSIWPVQYSIGVGIATLLGAGSAATLLAWARRSPAKAERTAPSEAPDPALMAAAQAEVAQLLGEDLTAFGAERHAREPVERRPNERSSPD